MNDAVGEMTCKELVELVTDYLEDRLSPTDRQRFDEHLEECDGCRTYLSQMRETIRAMGRLEEEHLSPDARDELLRVFRDYRRGGTDARPG